MGHKAQREDDDVTAPSEEEEWDAEEEEEEDESEEEEERMAPPRRGSGAGAQQGGKSGATATTAAAATTHGLKRPRSLATSKVTGVSFDRSSSRWKARVRVRLGSGAAKRAHLGNAASEERAAKLVSAGAYVLGDRCITKVPLGRFSNLAPAQGRALAVEVLGQARVAQLEQLVRSGQVGSSKATAKRRRAGRSGTEDSESSSSSSSGGGGGRESEGSEEGEAEAEEDEERVSPAQRKDQQRGSVRERSRREFAPAAGGRCLCRRRGAAAGAAVPADGLGGGGAGGAHGFKHVYRRTDAPSGPRAWYGQVRRGRQQKLTTHHLSTPEEAARAVDRFIYKVKGPEACNFPVAPELAAELDALTVVQIQEQFRQQGHFRTPTSKFTGVSFYHPSSTWQARVRVRLGSGQSKQTCVGYSASEEQAAEHVSAAAYVLGDRCISKVPLGRFSNLPPARGRALAVEVLGQARVVRLEELVGITATAKRGRARSDDDESSSSSSGDEESKEAQEGEEGGAPVPGHGAATGGRVAGADQGDGPAARGRQVEAEGGSQQQRVVEDPDADPTASWSVDALMARARASITGDMVEDAWMDVREGFEAQQQRSASASAACGPIDVSLGTAPHPAVRAGVVGLSEAFQTPEAVAAAWAGAQAEAEVFAERLGDEKLLDTSSLHRLTFLLAYSTLWLWQADELSQELTEPQRQALLQPGAGSLARHC